MKVGENYRHVGEFVRAEEGSRVVTFRASTAAKDRHRTKIKPDGIDTENFSRNPVFLWGHDGYGGWNIPQMENVLGRVVSWKKSADAFDIDVAFADKEVNPKGEMALRMVRANLLNTVSIGFIPREVVVETDDGTETPVITRCELLEVSLVPIPSNPEALALVRAMAAADGSNELREYFMRLAKQPEVPAVTKELATAPAETQAADIAVVSAGAVRAAVRDWQVRQAFSTTMDRLFGAPK